MTVLKKSAFYLGTACVALILGLSIFSTKGVMEYRRLKVRQAQVEEQVRRAEAVNRRLENEILSLKNDPDYIRHLARQRHGMAEADELVFKFTE